MDNHVKTYLDNVKEFTNDISFPVIIGSSEHVNALKSMVYAIELLSEKVERLELLTNKDKEAG